jgi:hypothetical protein
MKVWEFKAGNVNEFAPLVFTNDRDLDSGMFEAEGRPLIWSKKPKISVFVEPRKQSSLPLADIAALTPGALALNDRAKEVLAPLLSRFGQFLEMDCDGQPRWFYNITSVVSCIDAARSERRPTGALSKEVFLDVEVPLQTAVFKDPLTAPTKIYVNEAAKADLEQLIAGAGLLGAAFVEPGPPPKKARPRA